MIPKSKERLRIGAGVAFLFVVAGTLGTLAAPRLRQKKAEQEKIKSEGRRKTSIAVAQGMLIGGLDPTNLDLDEATLTSDERLNLFEAALRGKKTASAIRLITPERDIKTIQEAMVLALQHRNATVVSALIRSGVPLKPNSHGTTPLHWAAGVSEAEGDTTPCAEALIHAGVPLDSQQDTPSFGKAVGDTPLMVAAICNHPRMVRKLLQAGADPKLRDSEGHTALDLARERMYSDVVRELEATH